MWNIWKYALGSFSDDKTAPYDNYVACIRTVIFVSYMVTNIFIISGVIRHWNSKTGLTQSISTKRISSKRIPLLERNIPPSSSTNVLQDISIQSCMPMR